MFKKLSLTYVLVLFVSVLLAQAPKEKTLLWELTGNGIKKPSYLYGTIHLMCPQDLKMPDVVKEKFNATNELFLEIDLDDPGMMTEMMAGMMMKDTSTLKGLLGDNFETTNKVFKSKTGIGLELMNKAKPMLLMSLIYPAMLGCQPESWEKAFQKMAEEKKMELKGLEKLSEQIKVFDNIPNNVQADMLFKMMQNIDSAKISFDKMLEVYKSKDVNAMVSMITADKDFGNYENILLKDRNNNWIPVISEQAKKMPTFFACGAGHLGGADGVISLLRKQGFEVKPIMY